MKRWNWFLALGILLATGQAWGADGGVVFTKGAKIVTVSVGGGANLDLPALEGRRTDLSLLNTSLRLGYLPFDPVGSGPLRGSFEVGIEPFVQLYLEPSTATAEGVKAVGRYHVLPFAPIVPYAEFAMGVMHSNLGVKELRSRHVFSLEGGVGVSYLLTPSLALTGGYRFQHLSNAGTEDPNVGINSSTGILGASFFFK